METDYASLTVPELKKMCAERDVGSSAWRSDAIKADLVAALSKPGEAKKPDDLILIYSINPHDHYKMSSGYAERIDLPNGKTQIIPDKQNHILRFRNHRLWVTADELVKLRTFRQYGNQIMEAFPQNDGDPIAVSLDGLLESDSTAETNQGDAFLASIEAMGKKIGLRPAVKGQDIRNELKAWKLGKPDNETGKRVPMVKPTLKTRMIR